MEARIFGQANAMPAPTWHFLKMNDTRIEMPEGLAAGSAIRVTQEPAGDASADAFERAMADAQARWEAAHPAPTADELAEREAFRAAEADATYGGTALSAYQAEADAIEEARSLAAAFDHGTGAETASFLRETAATHAVVQAGSGQDVKAQVIVEAVEGAAQTAAIDVIAGRGSSIQLSIVVDGPAEHGGDARGFTGTTTRVFADRDSRVDIVRTQTSDEGFTDIDDMALFADERAHIHVRQTVLGGSSTFTGLAGDLRGDSAEVQVETRYLGHGDQEHDFNYSLRHHGTRTRCNLMANGVLSGRSRKTLRGTIDLVRGCEGAEGSENETVLLVDDAVKNKTVPVILCNEDDVAGNHGATIGHIRDEQLFYLASRGLSREAAESMFVGAVLEQAAIDAPDAAARAGVLRLGEKLVPGFANLLEGEE